MTVPAKKGAIFDMDGTLTDSMYIWDIAGITYLKQQGKHPAPDLRERLRPLSLPQAAALFQKEYGVTASIEEILHGLKEITEKEYRENVTLKAGVLPLLSDLKAKGVPLAVASSTPRSTVLMVLQRLGILSYFNYVVTCEDVGRGKDDPAVYHRAAALMGTAPAHTLVFEDALHAALTASGAGYCLIGVYDESEGINEDKIIPLCRRYVKSLTQINADILSLLP